MRTSKHRNLQPWLDYFGMLQSYEKHGYLGMKPEDQEAYITAPALYTLAGVSFSTRELGHDIHTAHVVKAVVNTFRRIRTYSEWLAQHPGDRFALHVVRGEEPHDPLYTILQSKKRVWWRLWMKTDTIDVITY